MFEEFLWRDYCKECNRYGDYQEENKWRCSIEGMATMNATEFAVRKQFFSQKLVFVKN